MLEEDGKAPRALVRWDGKSLQAGQATATFPGRTEGAPLDLRVFVDRSVMEIYADEGRSCLATLLNPPVLGGGIEIYVEGGPASVNEAKLWPIQSIWPE